MLTPRGQSRADLQCEMENAGGASEMGRKRTFGALHNRSKVQSYVAA